MEPEVNQKKPLVEFVKRSLDIFFSFILLCALSWFILIIALLVRLTSKGPAFFKHERVGRYGKTIQIFKFRTMRYDNRPIQEQLSPDQYLEFKTKFKITKDPRVVPFGYFLRKTSIDELPQLINILIGDMSFVGPRPITEEETSLFGKNRDLLLKVKPGLTGYWAVNGRNKTTYDRRIELELYYVSHHSLWLDTWIFFKTLLVIFNQKDAE